MSKFHAKKSLDSFIHSEKYCQPAGSTTGLLTLVFCFVLHSHFKLLKVDDFQKVTFFLVCISCPVKEENSKE